MPNPELSATLKFPSTIFVSHFAHSTEESISLNVEENKPTLVAEYKLVRVKKLVRKIEEVPF